MVRGPAIVSIKGFCRVLGCKVSNSSIIVKEGKTLPFEPSNGCALEVETLDGGDYWTANPNVAGTKMWQQAADRICRIAQEKKSLVVLVLGNADAGKTTFVTFLSNSLLAGGHAPCVVDADLGQGDLAPPGVIGTAVVESQIVDLRNLDPDRTSYEFVGSLSPPGFEEIIIKRIASSLESAQRLIKEGIFVINTDGYITNGGIRYKFQMAEKLRPDVIVCLGRTNTLNAALKKISTRVIRARSSPFAIKSRAQRIARRRAQFSRFVGSNYVTKQLCDIRLCFRDELFGSETLVEFSTGSFLGLSSKSRLVGFGFLHKLEPDSIVIQTSVPAESFDVVLLSDIVVD